MTRASVAVVIPCYNVANQVLSVIQNIGPEVQRIFCVDDCCPQKSGDQIRNQCDDPRVTVLTHSVNKGVGGAVVTGYRAALDDGANVIVKLDGDGQMNSKLLPSFIKPILDKRADYTKGNRFTKPSDLKGMPIIRLFGNSVLSLLTKLSSGYWNILDPTNGYTAVSERVLRRLDLDKISRRYFFESDMLFHLRMTNAVVMDIPMRAVYTDSPGSLKWWKVLPSFTLGNLRNTIVRIFYLYLIRDFSLATLMLLGGLFLLLFGSIFGTIKWVESMSSGQTASAGTVMLAGLPVITGLNLILSFIGYDISSVPKVPVSSHVEIDDTRSADYSNKDADLNT